MISRITQSQVQPKTLKQNQQNNNKSSNPSFKGPVEMGTQVLNYLNTSPAVGACFVDFFSMVLPRTLVDFSRSADAGMETGFRESSGTINHAAAGVVGLGAGYLVSSAFNKSNGVKAHLLFANNETIDKLGSIVEAGKVNGKYDAKAYWTNFFNSIEGYNTTDGKNAWKTIDANTVEKLSDVMTKVSENTYKTPKATMAEALELVTGETGAGSTFRFKGTNIEGSAENLIDNAYAMRKTVVDRLAKINKDLKQGQVPKAVIEDLGELLKGIKNKKVATVVAGLAVPVGVGMSVQPLNRYLTKKRTGSDGFVGVEGREPDKTFGFKVLKTVLGLGIGSAMIATILKNPKELYTNIGSAGKEILSKLQYKGPVPTMNQFKFIYGMTIMSRIFAARDKNETRESVIKDTLGFANWLILGGFVSKLAAKAFDKNIVNYEKAEGKGLWDYITKSVEKTHEEILYPALKKLNISAMENGKKLPFRKLVGKVKEVAAQNTPNAEVAQKALSQLKYKNYAQLLGYVYSGVVLGWGIPKLNIAITKAVEGKKTAKADSASEKMKVAQNPVAQPLEPASKTFSAFGAYLN